MVELGGVFVEKRGVGGGGGGGGGRGRGRGREAVESTDLAVPFVGGDGLWVGGWVETRGKM